MANYANWIVNIKSNIFGQIYGATLGFRITHKLQMDGGDVDQHTSLPEL